MESPATSDPSPEIRRHAHPDLVACGGLLLLATVIMLPVFVKGFPTGFDAVKHYRWTSQFIDELRDGAAYPRWLSGANDGHGSPVPLYYPPLPFYVAAACSLVVGNTLRAISLSCWLALILSGLGMYALSRSTLSRSISFGAAALYMMAPYHLLDLYQGSSVAEFWSFAWVPFLLDGMRRVSLGRGWRGVAYVAASYALLVLTHVPIAFLTSLLLPIYALLLTRKPRALLRTGVCLALGAGIAAVFLVPVLFETGYVRLNFKFDYRDYFLFENLRAALTSPRFPSDPSTFSYLLDIDVVAFGLVALFLVSSVVIWTMRPGDQDPLRLRLYLAIWLTTALSLVMTTRLSAPIWRIVPRLSFLLFPYRWLVIASAGTCFLASLSASALKGKRHLRILKVGALAALVGFNLIISALVVWRAPHGLIDLAASVSHRDTREYRPVWWDGQLRSDLWLSPARVESGDAEVSSIDDAGIRQRYSVRAATESVIVFRTLYFPGWVARVDGSRAEVAPSAEGHLQLILEPGEHTLALSFEDTWPRTVGKMGSAVSLLIFLGVLLYGAREGYTAAR